MFLHLHLSLQIFNDQVTEVLLKCIIKCFDHFTRGLPEHQGLMSFTSTWLSFVLDFHNFMLAMLTAQLLQSSAPSKFDLIGH